MADEDERATKISDERLIVSLSWFENGSERERSIEDRLSRMFVGLAECHPGVFEWRTAGGSSKAPGYHDVLARGLADAKPRCVAMLVVCGHGHDEPQGVQLGDGIWDGSEVWSRETDCNGVERWKTRGACDLSQVDFLIQLSCSIGRVRQSGQQDVQGFCAELFLNRTRSVLAGRWPLHAGDSVRFADEVAKVYLKHLRSTADSGEPLYQRQVRGRAVAAARRRWAARLRAGEPTIGLNTVAGFELYGLP
jgi:hypothetical protein